MRRIEDLREGNHRRQLSIQSPLNHQGHHWCRPGIKPDRENISNDDTEDLHLRFTIQILQLYNMISKQKHLGDLVGGIQAPNSGHARRDARQAPGNSLLLFNVTLDCFSDQSSDIAKPYI